ncbi:ABC transporter permease [Bogoriella caseilytica]|uniref:Peptide/nickel transport system permease protein n=1 Tax=Bogoriella caseilytica TaxID=56055 RepID=A0A3N2BD86_9MICO|nr:ABC transporter permease [Bogoriella caseilytica]ROR73211.1 peptide/nickel transport system permease protein [Bogoriella caseilytica]
MSTETATPSTPPSPTAVRLARWKRSAGSTWKEFRSQKGGMAGLIGLSFFILLAIFGPALVDSSALSVTQATGGRMAPPGDGYILGTDEFGRSVALLTLMGARVTLIIGVAAAFMGMFIGTTVGIIAGHFEGKISWVLMRITEWFMNLPTLVLAVVLVVILGRGMLVLIIAIGVTSWAGTARVIRAQTRAVEGRPYLERARALGAGHGHQMSRHVLPNVMPLVMASTIMAVAGAILSESTLAFLGLYDPDSLSWGMMLNRAWSSGGMSAGAWWYMLPPGFMILLVVLCFTLCGRALETALNPRLRK